MLEAFGRELEYYRGPAASFRSYVLTPVLQRQLRGLPDVYTKPLRDYMATKPDGRVTIADATRFYLGIDPLDARCIPSYRRNLIYVRDARWHLAIVLGQATLNSVQLFEETLVIQDIIMVALKPPPADDTGKGRGSIPKFNITEVVSIVSEGLQDYFEAELKLVVRPDIPPTM